MNNSLYLPSSIDTYKKQEHWIKKNAKDPKLALEVLKERKDCKELIKAVEKLIAKISKNYD